MWKGTKNIMRKMMKWYLILLLLASLCVFGVWYASARTGLPGNAVLVHSDCFFTASVDGKETVNCEFSEYTIPENR